MSDEFRPYAPDAPEIIAINALSMMAAKEMMIAICGILRTADNLRQELVKDGFDPNDPMPDFFTGPTSRESVSGVSERGSTMARQYLSNLADYIEQYQRADKTEGDLARVKLRLFDDVDFRGGAAIHELIVRARDQARAAQEMNRKRGQR